MPKKKKPLILHYKSKAYWLALALTSVLCVGFYLFTLVTWFQSSQASKTEIPSENLLLVHEIESGEAWEIGENFYKIKVKSSHPRLVYFSALPLELVGNISMKEYQYIWANQFAHRHPNAALLFDMGDTRQPVTIVQLNSIEVDEAAGEVTYTARLLHIDETKHMLLHRDATQVLPEKFGITSMFIDGYPTIINPNDYGNE